MPMELNYYVLFILIIITLYDILLKWSFLIQYILFFKTGGILFFFFQRQN